MRILTGAGLTILFLSLFAFAPVFAAVDIPDPALCDSVSTETRKGRPGGAEVTTVDGRGPTAKMKHAQEAWSSASKASGKIPPQDKRHLCLALNPIKNPTNRSMHKDHSAFYCTLILNRDIQAYCYAMIEKSPKKCNLIVSKELEEECLSKTK